MFWSWLSSIFILVIIMCFKYLNFISDHFTSAAGSFSMCSKPPNEITCHCFQCLTFHQLHSQVNKDYFVVFRAGSHDAFFMYPVSQKQCCCPFVCQSVRICPLFRCPGWKRCQKNLLQRLLGRPDCFCQLSAVSQSKIWLNTFCYGN